jgi:putative Mg2+ transporter-C (MgtC) family protein
MEQISQLDLIIRLSVAVLCGILVGAERSRVGKRAGMRTYALVALGAALFIVIALSVSMQYANMFSFDPLRVASQIVVGIGFLGAGVIFVERQMLTGLTTAAGMWVVAAIGTACGFGLYTIALYVTFLSLFIFEILWYIENKFVGKANATNTLKSNDDDCKVNHHHVHSLDNNQE